MGSGKTSVGRALAQLTHLQLYDSDHEIEKRTGVDIAWIFEQEGERGFRKREAEVIEALTKLDRIILSTGGGAVLTESNRQNLTENGIVVYLQVSIEVQLARTERKKESRPVLMMNDSRDKLLALHRFRDPLYHEIADLVYDTDDLTPGDLAKQIMADVKMFRRA